MTVEKLSAPFTTDFPDEWYDDNSETHFWFAWRSRALQKMLVSTGMDFQAPLRGLEIGGGVAFFRLQVEAMTRWTVDVTDLNESALAKAQPSRGRTMLYNIDERHNTFRDLYDVIFLFDVLEHIEDPVAFLKASLWHLKPGGKVIINVPALMALYSRYDELVGHYRRYDKTSLQQLLQSADASLRVDDLRYWGFSLLPVAGVRKLVMRASRTPQEAVAKGFKISPFMNRLFRGIMHAETSTVAYPPAGTSLMLIATKSLA